MVILFCKGHVWALQDCRAPTPHHAKLAESAQSLAEGSEPACEVYKVYNTAEAALRLSEAKAQMRARM